jgi:hypothetical protein
MLAIGCAKALYIHVVDRDSETSSVAARNFEEKAVIIEQSNHKSTHQSCTTYFKQFRESIPRVPGLQSLWLKRTSRFPSSRCIIIHQHPRIVSRLLSAPGEAGSECGTLDPAQTFDQPLLERSRIFYHPHPCTGRERYLGSFIHHLK